MSRTAFVGSRAVIQWLYRGSLVLLVLGWVVARAEVANDDDNLRLGDRVIYYVNDDFITIQDLNERLAFIINQMKQSGEPPLDPNAFNRLRYETAQTLIDEALLVQNNSIA